MTTFKVSNPLCKALIVSPEIKMSLAFAFFEFTRLPAGRGL